MKNYTMKRLWIACLDTELGFGETKKEAQEHLAHKYGYVKQDTNIFVKDNQKYIQYAKLPTYLGLIDSLRFSSL